MTIINKNSTDRKGQALPEYSILISFVALLVVAVFSTIGRTIVEFLQVLLDTF